MKRRMSVSRCCCTSGYCTTNYETSYSDDFSSLDPGWFFSPTNAGSVVSGKMRLTSQFGQNFVTGSRFFKYDPTVTSSVSVEVTADAWSTSDCDLGVFLMGGGGGSGCQFFASPNDGNFTYGVFDGTSMVYTDIAQTPVQGDVLKIVLDQTSWNEGTTTIVFDAEFFINNSSAGTSTHTTINDPCTLTHGLSFSDLGFPAGGQTGDFEDYAMAET